QSAPGTADFGLPPSARPQYDLPPENLNCAVLARILIPDCPAQRSASRFTSSFVVRPSSSAESHTLGMAVLANDGRPTTKDAFLHFFSFFSGFSGEAAAPSSSVSCLPFFMTSGSAGAAAASPAIASAVGTSSSLMLMMCATG